MDDIRHRAAFDIIRYANCWEDAEILCAALQSGPGRRILSVASAGDNSFALLATGAEVVAADINPVQLACVELRREAIRRLEQPACLVLLGLRPATAAARLETYAGLRDGLSAEVRAYWDTQRSALADGFVHTGKFERYFRLFRRRVLPLVHSRRAVAELLHRRDREQRIAFYEQRWNNWRWRLLFRVFFSRTVMGWMGRDPEFFRYVRVPVPESILGRARYALTELETHTNPYLEYILTGNFTNALPLYLRPETYGKVKANLDRLVLHLGPVQDAARVHAGAGFDGYNLSDIFEYLDVSTCSAIYGALLEQARPGARFAYWNMLVPRSCPAEFAGRVRLLDDLSQALFARDQAFFYSRFLVEEVATG